MEEAAGTEDLRDLIAAAVVAVVIVVVLFLIMSLLSTSEADITENPLLLDDLDWIASKVVNAVALWYKNQIFAQKAQNNKDILYNL